MPSRRTRSLVLPPVRKAARLGLYHPPGLVDRTLPSRTRIARRARCSASEWTWSQLHARLSACRKLPTSTRNLASSPLVAMTPIPQGILQLQTLSGRPSNPKSSQSPPNPDADAGDASPRRKTILRESPRTQHQQHRVQSWRPHLSLLQSIAETLQACLVSLPRSPHTYVAPHPILLQPCHPLDVRPTRPFRPIIFLAVAAL
jgi:hypothetical protein